MLTAHKKIDFAFGFSYEKTSQLKKHVHGGNLYSYHNVVYDAHNLSLPICARYNVFKGMYIESGTFADLIISSTETKNVGSQNETQRDADFGPTWGFSLGLVWKIPVTEEYNMLLKSDYKLSSQLNNSMTSIYNRCFRVTFLFDLNSKK